MHEYDRLRTGQRILSLAIILITILYPPDAVGQETTYKAEAETVERARSILERYPVFDGHNDLPWEIRRQESSPMDVDSYDLARRTTGQTDLGRLRKGGVGAQFWSVYVPGEYADSGYARVQLEEIDIALRMIEKYPDLVLALSVEDVERAMKRGRIASLLGAEGGHAIENSLGALRAYYALGVRYLTLTHNVTLAWADAAQDEARHDGLTSFGEQVVREMNRLGMIVDLSHASPATMSDVLRVTAAPVIFSHSSARGLTDVPRNVPDSILARMTGNGGVVMVTYVPDFVNQDIADWEQRLRFVTDSMIAADATEAELAAARDAYRKRTPRPLATLADVADHIEHVRDIAGVNHVGIGSDYDGMGTPPVGLDDVASYPNLFAELLSRGWTEQDLGKLANGNIMRAFGDVESVSKRLRAETGPTIATPASTH